MYAVSSEFHTQVLSGAEQRAILLFDDAVFTKDEIALNGALSFTEAFCAEEDFTIGLCPSVSNKAYLMNYDGMLDDFTFGQYKAWLGVFIENGAFTPQSGAIASLVVNETDTLSLHSTPPYVKVNGSGLSDQPSFDPLAAVQYNGYVYVISSAGAYYKYDISDYSGEAVTVNAIMTRRGTLWAADNYCAKFGSNILYEYEQTGTYAQYEFCPMGVFNADRPATVRKTIVSFTAYDNMELFDVDITDWFAALTYPMTLGEMYAALCTEIGVTTTTTTFINSTHSYTVAPFTSSALTAKALLKYIAEAACSNARFDRDGNLELCWFSQQVWDYWADYTWDQLSAYTWDQIATPVCTMAESSLFSIQIAEYIVSQIDGLSVKAESLDVGVSLGGTSNIYQLLACPLITGDSESEISAMATPIYNRLIQAPEYTPITASIKGDCSLQGGDMLKITYDGEDYCTPIFTQTITWNGACRVSFSSTGNDTRDIESVQSIEQFESRQRMLLVEKSVDGLTVTATANTSGVESNAAQLNLLAEEISLRVTETIFNSALAEKADSDDVDTLYESIMTQTASNIEYVFNILSGNINDVSGDFDDYKSELTTYLRILAEGILEMGRSDSPMTMQLTNTQLSFLQSGIVLAYFANNKMYVTEAEMEKATIADFVWQKTTGGTGLVYGG